MTLRTFSFGGGVQSTAALVLAAEGIIDYQTFLFANVGSDSENPDTLSYVDRYAKPFAVEHGLTIIEAWRVKKTGESQTLMQRITSTSPQSGTPIPIRMANGAPGHRSCTTDFKIKVIAKWQKAHGATKLDPAITGLGISLDEYQRMRTDSMIPYQKLDYPLIQLRLDRNACVRIIQQARLPVPPKSACYFCPFHRMSEWQRMRREQPILFQQSVDLEKMLNERRDMIGKDHLYLTRFNKPLDEVVTGEQLSIFDEYDDTCESGYCMT